MKADPVPLKTELIVKAMSVRATSVRRQNKFVARFASSHIHGMAHHRSPKALTLARSVDYNIFKDR